MPTVPSVLRRSGPTRDFNLEAGYASAYRTLWERHWWWRSRETFVLNRLDRLANGAPFRRILDVGCGDGLFFDALARFGDVSGLEPDIRLLSDPERAKRITVGRLDGDFQVDAPFDLAIMLDVLEHIEDDRGALVALRSALKPGARLLMTVPALPWLWSRHDEVNAHFRRYTARTLSKALSSTGFVVEELRPFFAWTVAPMLVRRWTASAGDHSKHYRVDVPPRPVNDFLIALSRADHALTSRVRFPWGSSLFALAKVA